MYGKIGAKGLIDFIKEYAERNNSKDKVILTWMWEEEGEDEEYSFEGTPEDFVDKYTNDYDCIEGFTLDDVTSLTIKNYGAFGTLRWSEIFIEIYR